MPAATTLIASRAAQRLLRLRPPLTRAVTVERDVDVPMPDGVVLRADRFFSQAHAPTVLVRTPYGRGALTSAIYGRPLAERGFQVLIQSVRGTGGSGGSFTPMVNERDDGLATVRWIRDQPWFGDSLAMTGGSYLGYTQWAVADDADLDALCLQATMPSFDGPTYDGGSFSLGLSLLWTQRMSGGPVLRRRGRLREGLARLPLREGDVAAAGRHVDFYQDWLTHAEGDEFWSQQSHTSRVPAVNAPISMRTGWYDIFLPWMLRDYRALAAAGNPPRLTIGPWAHASPGLLRGIPRETIDFLSERLLGSPPRPGGPVRYYVTGADEWRDSATWPPPGTVSRQWSLRAAGELLSLDDGSSPPTAGSPPAGVVPGGAEVPLGSASRFRYDPAEPTPAVGGPSLDSPRAAVDNRSLEHRSDVLVFTSLPLMTPFDVVGTPVARVLVSADNPNHDLFVRICDVDPSGSSTNVSDRLLRLDDVPFGVDGVREAVLELWPLAHHFGVGHRIRVQVSGGAHPRYARNPGRGEPRATASGLTPSTVSVHHDDFYHSVLILPVLTGVQARA